MEKSILCAKISLSLRNFFKTTGFSVCSLCTVNRLLHILGLCYETHGPSTIIVFWIELKILDQIVKSASFWPKKSELLKLCIRLCTKRHNWQSFRPVGSYLFVRYNVLGKNAEKRECTYPMSLITLRVQHIGG